MSSNAFARILRAAPALLCTVFVLGPAQAQVDTGAAPAAATPTGEPTVAEQPQAPKPTIRNIVILGTQRIETGTVMSYISVRQGDEYDEQAIDRALKALFATGLFADVKFNWDGATLSINVVENP